MLKKAIAAAAVAAVALMGAPAAYADTGSDDVVEAETAIDAVAESEDDEAEVVEDSAVDDETYAVFAAVPMDVSYDELLDAINECRASHGEGR